TPACSYANNVSRNDYQDLTRDMLGLPSISHRKPLPGIDVLIGCGWGEIRDDDRKKQGNNYVPGNKYLTDDDLQKVDFQSGGSYVVAQRTSGETGRRILNQAAMKAANQDLRLLGFFGHTGGHLPYQTADGNYDPTRGVGKADRYTKEEIKENPTLADMTNAALKVLGKNEQGFWLMIEAGDVDWANHNNNIDDSIGAVLSGEAAFEAVTDWIESNSNWKESAVIVTADHGHYLVLDQPEVLTGRSAETEVGAGNATNQN
ncbi:MAG: alkaline phosphatase, partial [Planctomycetota bacterium]